ncbi:MAG: hypothetical protein M3342_25080 [Bacteroidota bacterium]|nr:hypothetical protein [Bacteroidota bacterium]
MAINKNHEFEELNGVKCAIVEKNVSKERMQFLKDLLEFNKYTVIAVPSAPAKPTVAPKPAPAKGMPQNESGVTATDPPPVPATEEKSLPPPPETFTVGVTDVMFNPINAIFGRLLKTPDGHVVTLAYWQQKDTVSHDDVPYFEKR